MALVEIKVPDIGDFDEVAVIELLAKVGDNIKVEQSLITVESDKASMEIPSSQAGVLKELKVALGDKVKEGSLVAILEVAASAEATVDAKKSDEGVTTGQEKESVSQNKVESGSNTTSTSKVLATDQVSSEAQAIKTDVALPAHAPSNSVVGLPYASPSVRQYARLLGVPLEEIKGSGAKGRVLESDVQAFSQAVMAGAVQTKAQQAKSGGATSGADGAALGLLPWPKVDFTKFGEVERKELGRIKKISGANLHRNWVMIPHVTNHDDCDITDLEAFRIKTNKENEKTGLKLSMLAFLMKASVGALKKFPEFNSSLDGDSIVFKKYYHIGFAADTPNGLVVPVVRDCDKKGVIQIAQEMGELAKKARDGKLSPGEMSGASFTISSLGGIGGRYFTPIINAPEVAILGVCKSTLEPVWNGSGFEPRLMLPLSLSWDHRVIDGAAAARFNGYLGALMADFRRLLL